MPGEQPHIIYKLPKITLVTHTNMLSFLLKLADLRMFGRRKERGETNTWLSCCQPVVAPNLVRTAFCDITFWQEEQAQEVKDGAFTDRLQTHYWSKTLAKLILNITCIICELHSEAKNIQTCITIWHSFLAVSSTKELKVSGDFRQSNSWKVPPLWRQAHVHWIEHSVAAHFLLWHCVGQMAEGQLESTDSKWGQIFKICQTCVWSHQQPWCCTPLMHHE